MSKHFFCNRMNIITCTKQSSIHIIHPSGVAPPVLLFFTILNALYSTIQSACLDNYSVPNITMSILKWRKRFCKNQVFVTTFISHKISSPSKDEKTLELFKPSNPGLNSAVCKTPQYSKDDLQQILKTVPKAQLSPDWGQDRGISRDFPEQALNTKAPNIYKGNLYMNCYNFI